MREVAAHVVFARVAGKAAVLLKGLGLVLLGASGSKPFLRSTV